MTTLLLYGGTVHVFDDARTRTDAILFDDGRVRALGDDIDVGSDEVDVAIDLEGRTVLPGFNDAHTHIMSVGTQLVESDLSGVPTRGDALELLAANAADTDSDEWVLGFAYDESEWPEGERTHLTREDLDTVSEEHPVAAWRVDGHAVTVNSRGLETVDFAGVEDDVRVDDDGNPTGVVVEDATGRITRATQPTGEEARRVLDAAVSHAHELGITSIQTMAGMTATEGIGSPTHRAFFGAWADGDLPIRTTFYVHPKHAASLADLELAPGFGDEYLRIGGLKTFSDGSIGAQTAKLGREFTDDPGNDGLLLNDADELEAAFQTVAGSDQQLVTHAIGGEAIDLVLELYEEVLPAFGEDPRFRIEHVELASDEALTRMADLDIVASMQPNFLQWSRAGGLYERRLGADSLATNNRFRDVLDAGITLAFGSDKMPFGPLYGIHHAVNAPHESQRLTVDEAIAAYTRGAAYAEFEAERKGSLEPGMLGDAVVLERDPLENPETIESIGVESTIVGGSVVYTADEN